MITIKYQGYDLPLSWFKILFKKWKMKVKHKSYCKTPAYSKTFQNPNYLFILINVYFFSECSDIEIWENTFTCA